MACRRCSTCGLSFPLSVSACPVCDDTTAYLSNVDPDKDWEHAVELALSAAPTKGELQLRSWRLATLKKLGFDGELLELLTIAPTDLHLAADLVEAGCPVGVAARILL